MSRSIVALTTAFALLLHMVLGCCLHHAHAAEQMGCERSADDHCAVAADEHAHAGHNHHASSSPAESPTECPATEDRCADSQCVFLTDGNVSFAKLTTIAWLPLISQETMGTLVPYPTITFRDTGGNPKTPTRLHLLHQVMLI